jgi:hypothetical protein
VNRQFDNIIGRFTRIDPITEGQEHLSLYQYGWNNPILKSDPNGQIPDDYFNKQGKYLGSDNAPTDNVRIIDQVKWDENKTVNEEGKATIDNQVGTANSQKFSESNLDNKTNLKVYQHYNTSDLKLSVRENKFVNGKLAGGMAFGLETSGNKLISKTLSISVLGNKINKVADHANEIKNIIVHELQHYSDFKTLGVAKYLATSTPVLEQRAIYTQINDPSYAPLSDAFKRSIAAYGKMNDFDPTKPMTPLK